MNLRQLLVAASAWLAAAAAVQAQSLTIPLASPAVLDGSCSDYGDGVVEPFQDAAGATGQVFLKHDGEWLWICVATAGGTYPDRSVTVYLDRAGDGGAIPLADDAVLELRPDNGRSSGRGAGTPGAYAAWPGLDQHWAGQAASVRTGELHEFRVSLLGAQLGTCDAQLGIAIVHAWVNSGPGDDYVWPAGAAYDLPGTWRPVSVAGAPCACGGRFLTIADAEIREDDPAAALGGAPELFIARGFEERRALAAFDLAPGIPAEATIESAILELPLAVASGTVPYDIEARRLDESWAESGVTWNAQPTSGPVYASRTASVDAGPLTLDVTTLARAWATGGVAEQSLALTTPTSGAMLIVTSRETEPNPGGPALRIVCSPPAPDVPADLAARDAAQALDLARVGTESLTPTTLRVDEFGGGVRFASFALPLPAPLAADGATRARWFLDNYRALLRIDEASTEWQLVRRSADDRHLFFRQRHAGIPVYPAGLIVHLEPGTISGVAGRYVPDIVRSPVPRLDAQAAEAIATAGTQAQPRGISGLTYVNLGLLGADDRTTYLAWAVHLSEALVLVDAHSGRVLDRISHVQDAGFLISNANHFGPHGDDICWWPWHIADVDFWLDESGALTSGIDSDGWTTWTAMSAIDDYWSTVHGRDSYDDDGADTWLFVHTGTLASWGSLGFPQAISSPTCDNLEFSDATPSLDIVAHEYTHNVTRYVAALVYKNQSGALNESMSDVFAQFLDDDDWTIGEGTAFGAVRDLSSSVFQGFLSIQMSNVLKTTSDNGGVHTNSAIPNRVAYLISAGGVHNGYPVTAIGEAKTERLWYHVLNHGLWWSSQFADARDAFVSTAKAFAAKKKFAFTAQDACSVQNAWAAVGIGAGDLDCDGVVDSADPDVDGDTVPDVKDNCPVNFNPAQTDTDKDLAGDACDSDDDGDGRSDATDNCPLIANPLQSNAHPGPKGDACDDQDGDGVMDATDNCTFVPNPDQKDADANTGGDVCDDDDDNDTILDSFDNCPLMKNFTQADGDADDVGDACDLCPTVSSPDNADTDHDGSGNPCDDDDDNDGVLDPLDNCPLAANATQLDLDEDGVGLACDEEEQDWFSEAVFGGLIVPVQLVQDLGPIVFPLPIGPADGPEELPAGFHVTVSLSLPFAYAAQVVGSDGLSWGKVGPVTGPTSFGFTPAANGATLYTVAGALGGPGALAAPSLLVPAPDQLRYTLHVFPLEPVDPGATFDLSLRYDAGPPPEHVSHTTSDRCAASPSAPGDGVVTPGEDAALAVALGLEAPFAAPVTATLSTTTPGVTVTRPFASFSTPSGPGAARSQTPHFAFTVDEAVPCGASLDFDLAVVAGSARSVRHLSIVAGGEVLAESTYPPNPCVDLGTVASPISVTAAGTVASVEATVWITHPETSQLELWLVAPGGQRVALALAAGTGADYAGTTFDDDAVRALDQGASPFPARFRPAEPLGVLAGLPAAGTWSLEVSDTVPGGPEGTLDDWSLRIETAGPTCTPCAQGQPGQVAGVRWDEASALSWDAAPGAAWYSVYEGARDDLPRLLGPEGESCLRAQASGTGASIAGTPAPDQLLWYLVRAGNGAGEGPAGAATAGPRMQDSLGDCP